MRATGLKEKDETIRGKKDGETESEKADERIMKTENTGRENDGKMRAAKRYRSMILNSVLLICGSSYALRSTNISL